MKDFKIAFTPNFENCYDDSGVNFPGYILKIEATANSGRELINYVVQNRNTVNAYADPAAQLMTEVTEALKKFFEEFIKEEVNSQ